MTVSNPFITPSTVRDIVGAAYNNRETIYKHAKRLFDGKGEMQSRKKRQARRQGKGKSGVIAKGASSSGVSKYKQSTVQFKKGKGKKRSDPLARKIKKVVTQSQIKERGSQRLIFNSQNTTTVAGSVQGYMECHLYSMMGQVAGGGYQQGLHDVQALFNDYNTYKLTRAGLISTIPNIEHADGIAGVTVQSFDYGNRLPILFDNARLDVTWINVGTTLLECDLYTIIYSKTIPPGTDNLSLGNSVQYWHTASTMPLEFPTNVANVTSLSSTYSLDTRGVTLFDLGKGLSYAGAKIVKKEKIMLPVNEFLTREYIDSKNRHLKLHSSDGAMADETTYDPCDYAKKGWTYTYFMVFKSVDASADASLQQRWTRSYKYSINGVATPHSGFYSGV